MKEINKNTFIQTLDTLQKTEIAIKLSNLGFGVEDVENAMNGRLSDLEEVIDIHELSTVTTSK